MTRVNRVKIILGRICAVGNERLLNNVVRFRIPGVASSA